MAGRFIAFVLFAFLLTSGCSHSDTDKSEIIQTLSIRANALNSRDLSSYFSVISLQFNDKGKDFSQLKKDLEKNFSDFKQISYEAGTPAITISGASAKTVGNYRMKVLVRGKEIALNGIEHIQLAKEPGGWKIIAGI
ncbi:MAG: hypothetical protein WCI45_14070 [Desulfuromonadales bacterium]